MAHVVKGDNEECMQVRKDLFRGCREIKSYTSACIKNKAYQTSCDRYRSLKVALA